MAARDVPAPPEAGVTPKGRGVVDGAFRLLDALPDATGEGQVSDLARLTGIPRSSVHRLLAQLVETGFVEHDGSRYVIAPSLMRLARRVEPIEGLRSAASGVLQSVREQSGATVSLVVPSVRSPYALRIVAGREAFPFDVYDGIEMGPTTAAAIALRPDLDADRYEARTGAAIDRGHCIPDMTCYAARVVLPGGGMAALQIASMSEPDPTRLAPLAHRAASELSAQVAALTTTNETLQNRTTAESKSAR